MISIPVSHNFINDKLNIILANNNLLSNETILNYGVLLFENQHTILNNYNIDSILKELNDSKINFDISIKKFNHDKLLSDNLLKDSFFKKEQEYIDIIQKLKNDKNNDIASLIDKGKQLTSEHYDKIIDLHSSKYSELKLHYEYTINDLNSKNYILENSIKLLQLNNSELNNKIILICQNSQNSSLDNINSNISCLNDKFSSYFDKIFKGNTEKGAFGENFIQNYIIDKFTNSFIIDTHKDSSKGDFLFIFDNIKLLIESKNVQLIKKDDIDKFYRDVDLQSKNNSINSALLISLNDTNLINGARHFHLEFKNNLPIIMISNVFNNVEFIRFAILSINYILKNCPAFIISDQQKNIIIASAFNNIYDILHSQLDILKNDKIIISNLHDSFKKREVDILNLDKLFINLLSKYPDIFPPNLSLKNNYISNHNNNNHFIDIIKKHIADNPSFIINSKSLASINIPISIIKNLGGIKNISILIQSS